VFKENTASHVTSGVLTTGKVTYEIIDPKVAVFMDALHEPVAGTIQLEISPDSEAYINAGIHSTLNVTSPPSQFLNGIKGSEFEIRITLTESGSLTVGPYVPIRHPSAYPNGVSRSSSMTPYP